MPLITEPTVGDPPDMKSVLQRQLRAVAKYLSQQGPSFEGPITINTEKYGYSAGGFPWQDNLQAAGEIARQIKAAFPNIKLAFYAPCPRTDFFQGAGDTGTDIVPQRQQLYIDGLKTATKYLKTWVKHFCIDAYVPWRGPATASVGGVPGYLHDTPSRSAVADYHYARYPDPADDRDVYSPGYSGAQTWQEAFLASLSQRINAIKSELPEAEIHVWTGTAFLPNGMIYNNRVPAPDPMFQPPVWQVLMSEATFRTVLDLIYAVSPDVVVLLEGWSDEKQAVFDWFREAGRELPVTDPITPGAPTWFTQAGRGALVWNDTAGGGFPEVVHPYLKNIVLDYGPEQ